MQQADARSPSQNFRGSHGKAYLFNSVVNMDYAEPEGRNITTGRHTGCDASCWGCKEVVGWSFVKVYEASETYKEGKIVVEAELLRVVE